MIQLISVVVMIIVLSITTILFIKSNSDNQGYVGLFNIIKDRITLTDEERELQELIASQQPYLTPAFSVELWMVLPFVIIGGIGFILFVRHLYSEHERKLEREETYYMSKFQPDSYEANEVLKQLNTARILKHEARMEKLKETYRSPLDKMQSYYEQSFFVDTDSLNKLKRVIEEEIIIIYYTEKGDK